ncbi:hypothetical protein [Streptantibioticus ferralitis]|uniref:Integral membrane protein n=1 Tax=Streptantibioticus ferralitis TaxID=236510 RepID=A0ABT5YX07_9ACTN|nr:hypothetical protein [Streptantibioticus ferralitis]MDF2256132.1 hypothetical protein [Streptantibioticus ferralitis]
MSTTHTAGPVRHGRPHHRTAQAHRSSWVVPTVLGVIFGAYALFLEQANGVSAGTAALRGLVAAVVMAAVCFLIGRRQRWMQAESQAIAYGVVFGMAMGYLINLSGATLLKSSLLGLAFGGGMVVATFYLSYARRH